MNIRDDAVRLIKETAKDVLKIPLHEFLNSEYMRHMKYFLGDRNYVELSKLIKLIYSIFEIIDIITFGKYSKEEVLKIQFIASELFTCIQSLKNLRKNQNIHQVKNAYSLFNTIRIQYEDLEFKLQKSLPEKDGRDVDIKIAERKKYIQEQSLYTDEARDQAINEIKKLVDEQLKTPIDELLNSAAIDAFIKRIEDKSIVSQVSSDISLGILRKSYAVMWIISLSSLSYFSHSAFIAVIKNTHELVDLLQEIKEFEFKSEAPDTGKAIKLIIKTSDILKAITKEIDPCMTYLMHEIVIKPDLLPALVKFNESRDKFEKLNDSTNSILKTLVKRVKTIDTLTMEFKEATSAVGSTFLTRVYSDQSKKLEKESGQWLIATSLLAASAVIFACFLLRLGSSQTEFALLFAESSLRIFILGVLITATLWCGRNYRTVRHQEVINIERATIIKTIRAFSESSDDKKVKDLVLTEAVRSVFAPSPTGFVDHSLSRDTHGAISMINSPNSDKSDG